MTPSQARKKGREAFFPEGNPEGECPYADSWNRKNWIEGWNMEDVEQRKNELAPKTIDERVSELEERICALEEIVQGRLELINNPNRGVEN